MVACRTGAGTREGRVGRPPSLLGLTAIGCPKQQRFRKWGCQSRQRRKEREIPLQPRGSHSRQREQWWARPQGLGFLTCPSTAGELTEGNKGPVTTSVPENQLRWEGWRSGRGFSTGGPMGPRTQPQSFLTTWAGISDTWPAVVVEAGEEG